MLLQLELLLQLPLQLALQQLLQQLVPQLLPQLQVLQQLPQLQVLQQQELKGFHRHSLQRHRAFRESLQPYREDHGGSKALRDEHRPS